MKTVEEIVEFVADLLNLPAHVAEFLKDLPWQAIEALYEAALTAGEKPGRAADRIARTLDQLVDFRKVVAGPKGQALEMVDGPAIRIVVALVLRFGLKLGS